MRKILTTSLLLLTLAAALAADEQTPPAELAIGDLAPQLKVGQWVQGEPVQDFDSNHVYILEFWATWCGPCRVAIPHLNELAEKFKAKGVIVIGQDIWDTDAAVAPFVKQMGEKMTYRVALDDKTADPDGFMALHWWKRGVNHHGIPMTFIINKDRRIAWMGYPMALKDDLVQQILSNQYDLTKAALEYAQQKQKAERMNELNPKLLRAIKERQWGSAATAMDEMLSLLPEERRRDFARDTRLQILLGQKKYDQAYQFADSFGESSSDNDFAWTILTQKGVEQRNVSLALKFAERANKAISGTNAAILDTLARAQFMCGKTNEAILTEQQAVKFKMAGEPTDYEKVLASYREGKLPEASE